MGGSGSTRWKDHQKAPLVEDARQLDVTAFAPALQHSEIDGVIRWTDGPEVTDQLAFSLGPASEGGARQLVIDPGDDRRRQLIRLERARLGWYSGWLFRCPTDCGRRVRKLYALPKWMVFSCRKCAGLTYRSVQQHDSRVDLARRDPEGFLQSRSKAPNTTHSQIVTVFLAERAQASCRRGRGWGKKSATTLSRMADRMCQEYDRWRSPPEDSGKVTGSD
jgi:hypothetical protein